MRIQWCDLFVTGNPLVDHQHQALFEAINGFDDALASGAGPQRIDELLTFLEGYTKEHFATEEFLMIRAGFPNLDTHKGEHERLLTRVKFIVDLRNQDPALVPPEGLSKFLGDWLQNHILLWDLTFFNFLRHHPLESA